MKDDSWLPQGDAERAVLDGKMTEDLPGKNGVVQQLIKDLVERVLQEELTDTRLTRFSRRSRERPQQR